MCDTSADSKPLFQFFFLFPEEPLHFFSLKTSNPDLGLE